MHESRTIGRSVAICVWNIDIIDIMFVTKLLQYKGPCEQEENQIVRRKKKTKNKFYQFFQNTND